MGQPQLGPAPVPGAVGLLLWGTAGRGEAGRESSSLLFESELPEDSSLQATCPLSCMLDAQ